MTTEMMKFKRAYHELGNIAFKLKSKGHDLFIEYSPHAFAIHWKLYVNGWSEHKSLTGGYCDGRFYGDYELEQYTVDKGMERLKKQIKELLDGTN